ncbi:efflux RND transporter permease subunit [Endozoicomonadaceae bacterium StTr2]
MKLPRLAINNHQFTLVIILLLMCLGILSFKNMPRSEDPIFVFPMSSITVLYPGTSPVDMEKLVVDPIEDAIYELDDVKVLKTNMEDGLAVIRVEFLYGSDPDKKYDDVVSAISRIRKNLPQDIQLLDIEKISPGDTNILQVALLSETAPFADLKTHAEKLETLLERVDGVKRADIDALPDQQVLVLADLDRMNALGIGLNQLAQAVRASGANLPGGHVVAQDSRFTVRTSGDYRSLEDIRRTAIQSEPGRVVYIEDVAEVRIDDALPVYKAFHNGSRGVFISALQRKGSNIMEVMDNLKLAVTRFEQQLPQNITLQIVHDQSESVDQRVNDFFDTLLQGLLLVGLLTLACLGLRAATVVVLAIPMSVIIALGWLDFSGFGLQQMSIVGLVIALGLLVDNAIVVTENVGRFLRTGHDSLTAATEGASQVGWAVVSGTLTTILAFFPVLLLQTHAGTFMRSMPVTVTLTLIASLVIALTLTPLLASRFLKVGKSTRPPVLLRGMNSFSSGPFSDILNTALNNPTKVLVVSVLILGASVSLVPQIGVSLFPKAEKPMLLINIDMPENADLEATSAMAQQVTRLVARQPLVSSVTANIGKGNPRVYYNIFRNRQVPSYAQLLVKMKSGRLQDVEPMVEELRKQFRQLPGANIRIKELMQGPPYEAPIAIRVLGDDLQQLQQAAAIAFDVIASQPGVINADNPLDKPRMDLQVSINREKAAMLGVPVNAIDEAVRTALVGMKVSRFRASNGDDYDILIRGQGQQSPEIDLLDRTSVMSASGNLIPLKQLASLSLNDVQARLQHYDKERMARITADVDFGYSTEAITNEIATELAKVEWPQGIHWEIGGEQEQRKKSFGGMNQVLLVALLGIFAVLVLQFHSFIQPLIIFAAIPFAVTGAILALYLTGYTFSFTAFIGLTSLIGIVVNNSIILVDHANQLRYQDLSIREAILAAAQVRLVPILLTTMTTIGGLLPLTLQGSGMWSPMGWSIIGGLLVSTLLTLIVVPVLYQLLSRKNL